MWHLYTVLGTVVVYDIVTMYDVLLVLFIHSGFLPETVGRHTWTVYKNWNIAADVSFSTRFLSFTFGTRASKPNRRCWVCLQRAAVCTKLSNPVYWWSLFGTQDWNYSWAPISHSFEETLRETRFSFEVSLAAFYGMGAFSGSCVLLHLL